MSVRSWSLRYRNEHVIYITGDDGSHTDNAMLAIGEIGPQCFVLTIRAGAPGQHFTEIYGANFDVNWQLDMNENSRECRWGSQSEPSSSWPCLRFADNNELWEFGQAFRQVLLDASQLGLNIKFGLLLVYDCAHRHRIQHGHAEPQRGIAGLRAPEYLSSQSLEILAQAALSERHTGFLSWFRAIDSPHVTPVDENTGAYIG